MQVVITPADDYFKMVNEDIVAEMHKQTLKLFPSARDLELTWSSVVKIKESLYREAPGLDKYRPDQRTNIPNFYLAGSYTKQDYIDSMEGATLSGRQCAYSMMEDVDRIQNGQPQEVAAAATAGTSVA